MFKMPEIGLREIDLLTKKALDDANWAGAAVCGEPDSDWDRECVQRYHDWVNYGRQMFPDRAGNFMMSHEAGHGCRLPFDEGDRWEFDEAKDGWVILKWPTGRRIVARKPKEQK